MARITSPELKAKRRAKRRPAEKKPPDEYERKGKWAGKTLESEERRKSGLRNAPAAPLGNQRAGKSLVTSKRPELLVGPDEKTLDDHARELFEAMEDGGVKGAAYGPFASVLAREFHHYLATDHRAPFMSYNEARIHIRRARLVMNMLTEMGLTPQAQSQLGLRQAQELQAKNSVMPRRDPEHARKVANLLDSLGVLPRADSTVVEAVVVEEETYDDTPEPLPEAAARELGVRSIFDRELKG